MRARQRFIFPMHQLASDVPLVRLYAERDEYDYRCLWGVYSRKPTFTRTGRLEKVGMAEWLTCRHCHEGFEAPVPVVGCVRTICPPCLDKSTERSTGKREALKRSSKISGEIISREAVFERDHWICGLCGLGIDSQLSWPDPWSATLDHIVPLTRGGAHRLSNVQAAHARCNISKGNRRGLNEEIFS
jgi:hypothetical protein